MNFKLNFNSKAIEYAGDFELVINKPYHLIKNIFQELHCMYLLDSVL